MNQVAVNSIYQWVEQAGTYFDHRKETIDLALDLLERFLEKVRLCKP